MENQRLDGVAFGFQYHQANGLSETPGHTISRMSIHPDISLISSVKRMRSEVVLSKHPDEAFSKSVRPVRLTCRSKSQRRLAHEGAVPQDQNLVAPLAAQTSLFLYMTDCRALSNPSVAFSME